MPVKLEPGWNDPDDAPAGELLKLLVTDEIMTWEPPHHYVKNAPDGEFYPHRMNEPINHTLRVLGWRYAK